MAEAESVWLIRGTYLACGVVLATLVRVALCAWGQALDRRRSRQAREVLKRHGLTPQLYLASVGVDDLELRSALDEFSSGGYIVTDKEGNIVGKLCPKVVQIPRLRLVVSREVPYTTPEPYYPQKTRHLEGKALLDDMARWRAEVTATPEAAKKLLSDLGVVGTDGRIRPLIDPND
ncbi:hypothetical protein ACMHYO_11815 [Allopusillimonas ginsengisoli]|uniref:hypothetical protein n=1 Tax=Allopusillimonas ginsengisoli TaxID=453575 RepID=UPI0039C32243